MFLGLPLVGKRTIALRLKRYLRFFHGAKCKAFDVSKFAGARADDSDGVESGAEGANARSVEFFEHLRDFLESTDESPAADADADANGAPSEDARDGSSERSEPDRPSRPVPPLHRRSSSAVTVNGITPSDKNAKNVDSGRVAIVFSSDALSTFYENWSGSSKERRRWILARLASLNSDARSSTKIRVKTIFIEVTLTKSHFEQNILQQKLDRDVREGKLKAGEKAAAAERWKERVHEYKKLFVTLQEDGSEDDLSYIKLINYGERVTTNRMRAYLPQRIVQFLTATHPTKHTIYLCRHGESEYNTTGRLGGNSPLTNRGWAFAEILSRFAAERVCNLVEVPDADGAVGGAARCPRDAESGNAGWGWEERATDDPEGPTRPARLWTSSLLRTIQTASLIPHPVVKGPDGTSAWESMSPRVYRNIDEIFAGDCEGLTPEEMRAAHPRATDLRKMDKIGYRYPRGESYFDLISRLEPCIQEMESYAEPLLIVSHQAILRCIFAYLTGVDREKAPTMETQIRQNVVYQIDLDASSEMHITGDPENTPAFVTVWDFREEVERRVREREGKTDEKR